MMNDNQPGTPRAALYGLTLGYVVGYLAILVLELVRLEPQVRPWRAVPNCLGKEA